MEQRPYFDPVTALPTRYAFDRALDDATHRPGARHFTVLVLDLDVRGERAAPMAEADTLLLTASAKVREALRDGDFLARVAAIRFAILLAGATRPEQAESVCERIAVLLGRGETPLRANMGLALYPIHGGSAAGLMERAELALERVKQAGQGRWCWAGE